MIPDQKFRTKMLLGNVAGGGEGGKEEHQQQPKNGKASRRWLASQVDKVFEENTQLIKQLEHYKEMERSLLDGKRKLERELAVLKSRRAVGSHENEAIRERNKQLSQDVFLMKNILVKLNFELERYQEKLRKYEDNIPKHDRDRETAGRGAGRRGWIGGEVTVFGPLLLAYEESLKEKDDLIEDLRAAVERIAADMKEMVKENSQLRTRMDQSEKQGEVTYSDWLSVQHELSVTAEQNQLLTRQAKLAQSKISQLKSTFQAKLSEVCGERDELASRVSHLQSELLVLRGRTSTLQLELDRLKEDTADKIPNSVHTAYIGECKRLLDELKGRHEEERASLQKRISVLEAASQQQSNQSAASSAERIKELEKQLSECEERCWKAERRREMAKGRLDCVVAFAKELIAEHESLLKNVRGELSTNANLSASIEQIKLQLKGVEVETLHQIRILDENISSQVERVNKVRAEQSQEVVKLKEELASSLAQIQHLNQAAKKREEDMEMLWKTALSQRSTDQIELQIKNA